MVYPVDLKGGVMHIVSKKELNSSYLSVSIKGDCQGSSLTCML